MFQQLLSDLAGLVSSADNMVQIEGTYVCVKTQSFVDFLISLGKQ